MPPARWTSAVVVTVALNAGCGKTTETDNSPTSAAPPTSAADEEGAGDEGDFTPKETIEKNADGTCSRYVSVDCPPEVACNPPPPEPVPCPPELGGPTGPTGNEANDSAEDGGQGGSDSGGQLVMQIDEDDASIRVNPDGSCSRYFMVNCPEGAACNPPRPQDVPCPPELKPASDAAKAKSGG